MKKIISYIKIFGLTAALALAQTASAINEKYNLLDKTVIPGGDGTVENFAAWANKFFIVVIGLISAIAIVKIAYGGIQYILSATSGGKSDGKQNIMDALLGLGLALAAWFILNIINPDLVAFPDFLYR